MKEENCKEGLTAREANLIVCRSCHKLCSNQTYDGYEVCCPRCGDPLHSRMKSSISKTWAFTITGFILLFPANLYPVMSDIYLGQGAPDTIMSGVIHLMEGGMYPIAALVFIASIAVPIMKLLGLVILLLMVQGKVKLSARQCTRMYRFVMVLGRWSMLDLFMISILVTLVDLGGIATITAGTGATAFASVVVVTIFAAMSFDPRLIWDLKG